MFSSFDFSRNLVGKDGNELTLKSISIRISVGKLNVLVEVSVVIPRPSRKILEYYWDYASNQTLLIRQYTVTSLNTTVYNMKQ